MFDANCLTGIARDFVLYCQQLNSDFTVETHIRNEKQLIVVACYFP